MTDRIVYRNVLILMPVAIIGMLIFPMPALLVDALIALNLFFALIIFFIAFRSKKIHYFPESPTFVLLPLVFSLILNISAARLILTKGTDFDGWLIRSGSSLVAGSGEIVHLVAGFVTFVSIIVVLMVCIKKAVRFAEVAARFTLDAMPGKQMLIDAELRSGTIDENEHNNQKMALQEKVDFYCSLDGVCKIFAKNERLRLIFIIVTILVGIFIGYMIYEKTIIDAIKTYLPFIIGNGILSMIPVFFSIVSINFITVRFNRGEYSHFNIKRMYWGI